MKAWFSTFTGKEIDLFDMKMDDIDIIDIAHHLATINRFNGACSVPLSVAQHSVCVAVLSRHARQGLLHDASEAYLGDVTKWLKATPAMASYRALEEKIQAMIFEKYNCDPHLYSDVEWADKFICRIEGYGSVPKMRFCGVPGYKRVTAEEVDRLSPDQQDLLATWAPWDWRTARDVFLKVFKKVEKGPDRYLPGVLL